MRRVRRTARSRQGTQGTANARARARKHISPQVEGVPWAGRFLAALAVDPNVSAAAIAAGIGRRYVYKVREKNEPFAAAWDEAVEISTDALESEARRRGVLGVQEPIYQKGGFVGYRTVYSDFLLAMQLRAARPEKYRERHDVKVSPDWQPSFGELAGDGKAAADAVLKEVLQRSAPGQPKEREGR